MRSEAMQQQVQLSLAAFPGMRHEQAAQRASEQSRLGLLKEPLFDAIGTKHVQLVPQNHGVLDEVLCESLLRAFPHTQFRLHANVRVLSRHTLADVSCFDDHPQWFKQAAFISRLIKAPAYSAHSGRRCESDLQQMLNNARRMAELFGCPVGVEGQYPVPGDTFLVSTWSEYQTLFESGVPYALDLSHLNILACRSGDRELGLVKEMLNCERCIEVHVSDNDGSGDWHQVCENTPWWHALLPSFHPNAVIFTEGNHLRKRKTKGVLV